MSHITFSLNGTWEMAYSPDIYEGVTNPFNTGLFSESSTIENAVPGFWEDMTDRFQYAKFFGKLKINPEYGLQQYPILATCPDMALPNIMGNFIYRCAFVCTDTALPSALHFEGVQNTLSVWLNDVFLGTHKGYSAPFETEIPQDVLKNENTLVLSVSNLPLSGYDGEPVSGLTSRAANEYSGGITGDVSLWQYTSPLRDAAIFISDDCTKAKVEVTTTKKCTFDWRVLDGETVLISGKADGNFEFDTAKLSRWSPESPKLYTLLLADDNASLERTLGVRKLTAKDSKIYLNGKPYFMRGVCEHCYYPETLHQTHDITYFRFIIQKFKELGFNYIRFHTFVPVEEYMQAADELGMMLHIESPNNTTLAEWKEIVKFCRRHPATVLYCCGNELLMDEPFIEHLNQCADEVHAHTDALFAPLSAMRGLEYFWQEPGIDAHTSEEPFKHHPERFKKVGNFSDVYASYATGQHSYCSTDANPATVDARHTVYQKPRLSHEICINGTYTDLSLKDRYQNTRVGKTAMFSSLERHLKDKGVLHKAPLYFQNSCKWQQRIRKHCFEALRRSQFMAGYDFLGPIDTHWHTFGYDVGIMNEFYELKPGETVRNVRMYNSDTVILNELGTKADFTLGKMLKTALSVSHYGEKNLQNASLTLRLFANDKVIAYQTIHVPYIAQGEITTVGNFECLLPYAPKPVALRLTATLDADGVYAENEWELYAFPEVPEQKAETVTVLGDCTLAELKAPLQKGETVVLFGSKPFDSIETTFKIATAGRTSGNLATVISGHPLMQNMPHDGSCGWQFFDMLEKGSAVCFETDLVPFNPIIEVVSSHKNVIRQSVLFEFKALNGKLLVCSLNFSNNTPASKWFKKEILSYVKSNAFCPGDSIDEQALDALVTTLSKKAEANKNFAFNANDKTATRKNR